MYLDLERMRKAYKRCLSLRYKNRKTIPYEDLDICLYLVEEYIEVIEKARNL